jgi:uncharacterized protein YciI
MQFDHLTITLLILRSDAPQLNEEAAAALLDAHVAHIADLHEAGYLVASGPLLDARFRGLSVFTVEPEHARALKEQDPVVRDGLFSRPLPSVDGRSRGRLIIPAAFSLRPAPPDLATGLLAEAMAPHRLGRNENSLRRAKASYCQQSDALSSSRQSGLLT